MVFVLAFGAAEIVLRLAGLGPGRRGDVYESVQPGSREGRLSICVLGGSSVNGYPFGPRGGFPRWTEAILQDVVPGGDVHVANCGIDCAPLSLLADVFEDVSHKQPDAVVVYAGHNEWLEAELAVTANVRPMPDKALRARLSHTAVYWNLRRAYLQLSGQPEDLIAGLGNIVMPKTRASMRFSGENMHDDIREDVAATFEKNLRRIARLAKERNITLVLCTVASNRSEWPPLLSLAPMHLPKEDYDRWLGHYYAGLDALRTDPAQEKEALEQAAAIHEDHAGLLYSLAVALDGLGERECARGLFGRANDLDMMPSRSKSEMNAAVRKVAREYGAELVDVEQAFEDLAAEGTAGFDLFVDNCHPNLRGHSVIGRLIARALERPLSQGEQWHWEQCSNDQQLAARLELTGEFQAEALVRIANRCAYPHVVNRWVELWGPERHYPRDPAVFTRLFAQALELSEAVTLDRVRKNDPDCCYHLAAAYREMGRTEDAIIWAQKSTGLMNWHVDAHRLLIELYREAGNARQAEKETQALQDILNAPQQAMP